MELEERIFGQSHADLYYIYIELVLVVWEDKGDIASKRVCFPRVHMFLLL